MSEKMTRMALLLALVVSTGCGAAPVASCARMEARPVGSAAGAPAPQAPSTPSSEADDASRSAESAAQPATQKGVHPPAAAAAPRYAEPPAVGGAGLLAGNLDSFWAQFEAAEAQTLSAGADCAGACKALKSMQRSASGICSLASTEADKVRCHQAQERVRAARERIRSSCGQCQDGPSLDPAAPIEPEP
jgi:hypothetical protein